MIHILLLLFLFTSLVLNAFTMYRYPEIGFLSSSITIIVYLVLAVYDFYDIYARDILALCAGFIIVTFLNIFLNLSDLYTNTLLIYIFLLFISIIFKIKLFHEQKIFKFKNIRYIFISFPMGILLGFAILYFLHFTQFNISQQNVYQAVGIIMIMGIAEEFFFRGLIQNSVTRMTDTIIAITFTSILYGFFHFTNNITYVLLFILLSLCYSIIYAIWKNIYIVISLNILINITFYILTKNLLIFATF